jgi:hypothetical protein
MKITLMGKVWNFVRAPLPKNIDGLCDPPDKAGKKIKVRRSLRGERELEVIIHELRHAADWHRDEAAVTQEAKEIARVLWRLGYRKHH